MSDVVWWHFSFCSTLEVHSLTRGQSLHRFSLFFVRTESTKRYIRMPKYRKAKATKDNASTTCSINSTLLKTRNNNYLSCILQKKFSQMCCRCAQTLCHTLLCFTNAIGRQKENLRHFLVTQSHQNQQTNLQLTLG